VKARPEPTNFANVPEFNDWIDDQFEEVNGKELDILGAKPRPSEVLHRMSFDTYEAAFADYQHDREEDIKVFVTDEFPILIAHPFSRFLEGAEHEVQRLQFLRDTWEGLINFVHALVVSEARALRLPLADPVKCASLFSDSLAARLNSIEEILKLAANKGAALECAKIVDLRAVGAIIDLNRTRNAFSHCGAVSEDQAKGFINECVEDVFDVLEAFSDLRRICMLRYDRLDGGKLRHERFDGHAKTKRFAEITVTPTMLVSANPLLTKSETLVFDGAKLFSVRPFLHLVPKASGHVTEVAFFKKTQGDDPKRMILFEFVGEAHSFDLPRKQFQPEINEIRALFGLPPE